MTQTIWNLMEGFHIRKKTSAPCPSMWTFRSYPSIKQSLPGHQVSHNFYCSCVETSKVSLSRQLLRVWVWNPAESLPGTIHPQCLSSLSNVRHDELGLILRTSGNISRNRQKICICSDLNKSTFVANVMILQILLNFKSSSSMPFCAICLKSLFQSPLWMSFCIY